MRKINMNKTIIPLLVIFLAYAIQIYSLVGMITSFTSGAIINASLQQNINYTLYIPVPLSGYVTNFTVSAEIINSSYVNNSQFDDRDLYNLDPIVILHFNQTLSDNTYVNDSSGNNLNFTIVGGGGNFHFNGTNALYNHSGEFSAAAGGSLQYQSYPPEILYNYSMFAWIKPNKNNSYAIFDFQTNNGVGPISYINLPGKGNMYLQIKDSGNNVDCVLQATSVPVYDGQYHLIGIGVNGTDCWMSYDNIFINSSSGGMTDNKYMSSGLNQWIIGSQNAGGEFYVGMIDDFLLLNSSINLSILKSIYQHYGGNLTMDIGADSVYDYYGTVNNFNASFNASALNNILERQCICSNCSSSGKACLIAVVINSGMAANIGFSIANLTYSYGIDNCSNSYNIPSNATTFYIDFKDFEELATTVDYAATLQYSPYDENYSYYSLMIENTNNVSHCIYPAWGNLTGDFQIEYTDIDSETFNYFTSGTIFTNASQNLTLYTQNGTTQVLFTVNDINGDEVENAYIHVLKYDVGSGTYATTEVLKTDSKGQAVGNIILVSTFYNFLIYYEGELVYSELGVKVISTTRTFTISIAGADWYTNFKTTLGVNTNLYFSDSTNNFVYTFTDSTSSMHYGCMRVDVMNDSGHYTLADECEYTTSGTIVYNVPVLQNGTTYIATGYLIFDDMMITDVLHKTIAAVRDMSRKNQLMSLFMAFCFIVVCFTIGIPNPALAVTLLGVGMIFSWLLGLYMISPLMLGSIIILILIQMYIAGRQTT